MIVIDEFCLHSLSRRKNMSKSQPVCNICHKPLEQSPCYECDGKGYVRALLFFEKDCPNCQGRGWILRCPDALQHSLDRTREILRMRPTNSQKFRPLTIKPQRKPLVPPPGWNSNPLSPTNPNSPYNPNNPNSPLNPRNINNPNNPLNPNNPINKNPFKK